MRCVSAVCTSTAGLQKGVNTKTSASFRNRPCRIDLYDTRISTCEHSFLVTEGLSQQRSGASMSIRLLRAWTSLTCSTTWSATSWPQPSRAASVSASASALSSLPRPWPLFLDEPTSGLDASAALAIMALLKRLSSLGVIIHQPRPEVLDLFDGLTPTPCWTSSQATAAPPHRGPEAPHQPSTTSSTTGVHRPSNSPQN